MITHQRVGVSLRLGTRTCKIRRFIEFRPPKEVTIHSSHFDDSIPQPEGRGVISCRTPACPGRATRAVRPLRTVVGAAGEAIRRAARPEPRANLITHP